MKNVEIGQESFSAIVRTVEALGSLRRGSTRGCGTVINSHLRGQCSSKRLTGYHESTHPLTLHPLSSFRSLFQSTPANCNLCIAFFFIHDFFLSPAFVRNFFPSTAEAFRFRVTRAIAKFLWEPVVVGYSRLPPSRC